RWRKRLERRGRSSARRGPWARDQSIGTTRIGTGRFASAERTAAQPDAGCTAPGPSRGVPRTCSGPRPEHAGLGDERTAVDVDAYSKYEVVQRASGFFGGHHWTQVQDWRMVWSRL